MIQTNFRLAVVLPDIRSAQNVGAILRTADAAGVSLVITCGYTPHPRTIDDPRPPHIIAANSKAIAKSALGAELTVPLLHFQDTSNAFSHLHRNQYKIAALEQAEGSINLFDQHPVDSPNGTRALTASSLALVVGNEVDGLDSATLAACDYILELPMVGTKESLNVAVAAGIALYQLRFGQKN